jgi:hypothetical protein
LLAGPVSSRTLERSRLPSDASIVAPVEEVALPGG